MGYEAIRNTQMGVKDLSGAEIEQQSANYVSGMSG